MFKAVIISTVLITTAAVARAPADDPTRLGPDNDPDEVVCINEPVIGSRLTRNRVCRTRAEWALHRAETRKVVDRVQHNKQTFSQ